MNCITFCLFEMNTKFSSFGLLISSANVCKNHTLESLFFCSTTANAIGKILSFPSFIVTDNICPPNLPFKWQPYNPTSGLHPPPQKNPTFYALYLGLFVRFNNLSLQNHFTPHINYSNHLSIFPKLPILQPLIT